MRAGVAVGPSARSQRSDETEFDPGLAVLTLRVRPLHSCANSSKNESHSSETKEHLAGGMYS